MTSLLWINLITSLVLTIFARLILGGYYKKHPWCFYLFIFFLCCSLPVLGEILGTFIVFTIFNKHTHFHKYAEILNNPINLFHLKPFRPKYGAGGGTLLLLNQSPSTIERTAALFKLAESPLSQMNSLLYQLLPDNSDEIRLLAFNILDEQEGRMMQSIHKLQALLQKEDLTTNMHAKIEKNLAKLYWDLVYDHLILPELENSMLEKAQYHALSASMVLTQDGTLWSIIGKIYSKRKQYQLAEEAFNKASALNVEPSKVIPYLAEIYFNRRDYKTVHQYLSRAPSLVDIPLIAPVKRFWSRP